MKMDSPASESNENVYRYLDNIADLGHICSLRDAELIKKPLVTGKVLQKLPVVKKSKYQVEDVLVFYLKEVFSPKKQDLLTFRAIFVHTAARLVENICIEHGDYLAFCDVKLSSEYGYSSNPVTEKYVAVGKDLPNSMANVYYKRKNMMRWSKFQSVNPEFMEPAIIDLENIPNESVPTEQLHSRSSDENEIPSTSRNLEIFVPRAEIDEIVPSTSESSNVLVSRTKNTEKTNDAGPSKTNMRNAMSGLIEVFQEQSTSKINGRKEISKNRNEVFSSSGDYQYLKLKQLKPNSRVNVYGIVRRIVKKPTLVNQDKYHLVINIIDETKTDEFLVTIFSHSLDAFPKISPYCIIRLHRLQVEEYNGGLNAKVSHGRDVLVFDKDDTNITYSTAHKFTLEDSDKKRVEELKEWGLKELTNFRPFTSLNSLELKRKKINLRGKVSYVKVFEDFPNVALRIQDGTKCKVPYERLSLDFDAWSKVIINSKPCHSESEEIDIAVAEADGNFKTLKIGDEIELFNVEVTVQDKFEKTNVTEYLKLHVKGTWENLKLLPSKENRTKESQIKSALLLHKPAILSKPKCTLDIVKKRKLFDIDQTVVFEKDDSNVNQDKSTNTDNVEINSEANKRKTSVEIEEEIPMCSKMLKNNHIGNVPVSELPKVIEKVIPNKENGPVSRNGFEESENYRLNWPQPMSEVPFNIKVNLISSSPDIDENSGEQDVLSLVKLYCSTCQEFFSHHQAKWVEVEGENTAFCIKCKMNGYFRELEDVLGLKVHLLDQYGEVTSAVILRQNAEKFLGCTVADICSSNEVRMKVKDIITSYFCRAGREKKFLIVSILPVVQGKEIKYHITDLKPYVPFSV